MQSSGDAMKCSKQQNSPRLSIDNTSYCYFHYMEYSCTLCTSLFAHSKSSFSSYSFLVFIWIIYTHSLRRRRPGFYFTAGCRLYITVYVTNKILDLKMVSDKLYKNALNRIADLARRANTSNGSRVIEVDQYRSTKYSVYSDAVASVRKELVLSL